MLLRELSVDQLNGSGVLPAPRTLALTTVALVGGLPQSSAQLVSALAVAGGTTFAPPSIFRNPGAMR